MSAVILSGANPGVRLTDGGVVTAFASVWAVDWSIRGAGTALVLWHDDEVRAVGGDPGLAEWLARYFVRHFPEVDGLPWPAPAVATAPVTVHLDLATGLVARGGGIEVTMSDVLGRRTFATDGFVLDGVPHSLQLLLAPVADASITVDGQRVPGQVTVGGTEHRPSSSAFLATAEVWSV
ncbi:hypothetical protein [Actinophytocola sp. NPDC049390]|uniref:hypothetical protein n=1 Tax=Actinophytocola sp. NPDC049390 TaxID=3363894 RepID=UPI0037B6666A